MNSSFAEHEVDVLAAIGATTGGLSIFGGLLLLSVCSAGTCSPSVQSEPTHSSTVKAILSRLGLFDALYGVSFVIDAAAHWTGNNLTLNQVADYTFAWSTNTAILTAIFAWYLHQALVYRATAEELRPATATSLTIACLWVPGVACLSFLATQWEAHARYWLELVLWLVIELGMLLYVAVQYVRIQMRVRRFYSLAVSALREQSQPPANDEERQSSGQQSETTRPTDFERPAALVVLDLRLSGYLLAYALCQGPSVAYYGMGGHFEISQRTDLEVPFALAVARVVTQPLQGAINCVIYWHHRGGLQCGYDGRCPCNGVTRTTLARSSVASSTTPTPTTTIVLTDSERASRLR